MSVRSISGLKDREFEHLIFDLLTLLGVKNVVWRTPGSDGGRDLEGEFVSRDFSGNFRIETWFIECKVRKASLSWPDVYEKISYAENRGADHLLVCCSSSLSPKCKDEIQIHNLAKRRPTISFWDGADIVQRVELQPILAYKYRLSEPGQDFKKLSPLMMHGLKATQSAFELLDSPEVALPATLYLSVAISEFCNQFTSYPYGVVCGWINGEFENIPQNVSVAPFDVPVFFPTYALKVAISAAVVAAKKLNLSVKSHVSEGLNAIDIFAPPNSKANFVSSGMLNAILSEVGVLCDVEVTINEKDIRLIHRNQDGARDGIKAI